MVGELGLVLSILTLLPAKMLFKMPAATSFPLIVTAVLNSRTVLVGSKTGFKSRGEVVAAKTLEGGVLPGLVPLVSLEPKEAKKVDILFNRLMWLSLRGVTKAPRTCAPASEPFLEVTFKATWVGWVVSI